MPDKLPPGLESLELQWGEVDWRHALAPTERIVDGRALGSDAVGLGVELDEDVLLQHLDH